MSAENIQQINVEDGLYTIEVSLEGGSGRAGIQSPCGLEVVEKEGHATIVWSSPNYDYMIVGEEKYLPVNEEGNSAFEIPVSVYDEPMTVIADTTAMSVPHEIEYELTFDTMTLSNMDGTPVSIGGHSQGNGVYFAILIAALGIASIAFVKRIIKKMT